MQARRKVVVRKFPPGYSAEQFSELVKPWADKLIYKHFEPGKKPKPLSMKPVLYGIGYLGFDDPSVLLEASERLTGTHLVDSDGFEGILEVSLAIYQGLPPAQKPRKDPREGTIESTPEYLAFLAELEATANPTAVPLDKQADLILAKERELNPWKYEKDVWSQTPLLVHLKKAADAPIDLGSLLSRTGGGGGGGSSASKKQKKKKKKAKKESTAAVEPATQSQIVSVKPNVKADTMPNVKAKTVAKAEAPKPADIPKPSANSKKEAITKTEPAQKPTLKILSRPAGKPLPEGPVIVHRTDVPKDANKKPSPPIISGSSSNSAPSAAANSATKQFYSSARRKETVQATENGDGKPPIRQYQSGSSAARKETKKA